MFEMFGNYDITKIQDYIIELRKSKDYRPAILEVLEEQGALMKVGLKEEMKKKVHFKPKILTDMLKSLENKELIRSKLIRDENGQTNRIYWLPSQKEPIDLVDLKRDAVVADFIAGKSVEKIMEDHGIGQKTWTIIKNEENLERPSLFRAEAPFCNKVIRENWNWKFLESILEKRLFQNIKKLATFETDGKTYFDDKTPLKQDDIFINGKNVSRQSILSYIYRTDRHIKSIIYETALKMEKSSLNDKNLRNWVHRYIINPKEKFSHQYQFENFLSDFRFYIVRELTNPDIREKYIQIAKEDLDLINFGIRKRIKLDPNSDSAKIVQWFKNEPDLTKAEARSRARIWIEEGRMTMKKNSVHNVVNQSYDHFLEGDIMNLDDKIQLILNKLNLKEIEKISVEDLKRMPDFSRYRLDVLEMYLKKHKKKKF